MSMLRKTTITVAIVGAGLGSLTGAAFANTHHGSSHDSHSSSSCSNNVKALNSTKGGGFADVAGGDQTITATNVCHILDDNKILNHNTLNIGGTATTVPTLPGGGLPTLPGLPT